MTTSLKVGDIAASLIYSEYETIPLVVLKGPTVPWENMSPWKVQDERWALPLKGAQQQQRFSFWGVALFRLLASLLLWIAVKVCDFKIFM